MDHTPDQSERNRVSESMCNGNCRDQSKAATTRERERVRGERKKGFRKTEEQRLGGKDSRPYVVVSVLS